jgi:hypothetical protein
MLGKRGEGLLTENTLSMVIAAFCIAFLIFFGVKLYQMHRNIDKENALDVINSLAEKLELIKEGGVEVIYLQGFPKANEWEIIAWDKYEKGRPAVCWFSACVCAYRTSTLFFKPWQSNTFEKFNGDKVCRRVDSNKIIIHSKGTIKVPSSPRAPNLLGREDKDYAFVKIPLNILKLDVLKNKDGIQLSGPYMGIVA